MNKKEVKEEIGKIVAKYERLSPKERNEYNEAMTRKDFILPFFHVLGWDVYNDSIANEVKEEEPAVKGTVDYSFRFNNVPQFLLEAKAIKVDLDKIEWAKQSVSYGWNMGIEWVILTDFEGIKLFNASWKIDTPRPNLELTYKEYLDRFDDLWLFSKESFEKGELNKQAGKWGISTKRIDVTEKLASDLIEWRRKLFDNFRQWNEDKSEEEIDEAVQRILDRFIFMRSCEDKKIEPPVLWQNFQKWSQDMKEQNFLKILAPVFKEFDENYNSNLFKEHLCDNLKTEGASFLEIISGLYGDKESGVRYNFAAIKPDVLGKVYEQYLGHLLQKAGKRGEDLGKTKRKKQGIYYTPTFIVDYIVQHALGPILDKCKTVHDLKKIKVLDPACGSGSFLIKAIEMINEKYKKFGYPGNVHTKIQILTENIYGVDLDEQAVEITRLNLLLNALEKQLKFPLLNNIKNGNSLISGIGEELTKYFGKNFRDKKPFNWEEEFPEVSKQGGFDVIIGNPPYIQSRNLNDEERHFYWDKYLTDTNHSDIYSFFIEKAINLLKNKGVLGFIIPNTWLQTPSFKSLRKKIFNESKIASVLFFDEGVKIFKSVQVSNVILILQKELDKKIIDDNFIEIVKNTFDTKITFLSKIKQKDVHFEKGFNIFINRGVKDILDKIFRRSVLLNSVGEIIGGLRTGDDNKFLKFKPNDKDDKKLLRGRNVGRYYLQWGGEYVWYRPELMKVKQSAAPKESKFFETKEKLLIRMITGDSIVAAYDDNGFYFLQDNIILSKNEYNIKYLLAILNSTVARFIVKNTTSNIAITQSILRIFPIHKIDFKNIKERGAHNILVSFANIMIDLNKELLRATENSEKWQSIKSEIEKTDKKIDQLVYKLYGLIPEEIKIIEILIN